MNSDIPSNADNLYRDRIYINGVINASTVRSVLATEFKQVSPDVITYLNCLVYSIIEFICVKCKTENRLTKEDVHKVLSDSGLLIMNVGSIEVRSESVDDIVEEVMRRISLKDKEEEIDYGNILEGEDLKNLGREDYEQEEQRP